MIKRLILVWILVVAIFLGGYLAHESVHYLECTFDTECNVTGFTFGNTDSALYYLGVNQELWGDANKKLVQQEIDAYFVQSCFYILAGAMLGLNLRKLLNIS